MFENLKTDNTIKSDADIIGGYSVLDTNCYDFTIELAYVDTSRGGAMSFNLHLKDTMGNTLRNTQWMTSGTAKGGNNFYIDKQSGEKRYLPGFTQANNICLLACGKEISDLSTDDKVINLYDFKQRKEVPVTKQVITSLLNEQITVGVIRQTVDKTANTGTPEQPVYAPTGEVRDENEIDKCFRTSDGLTVNEVKAEATEATFKQKWLDKNKGITRNKAKGASPVGAVTGVPTPVAPQTSLFAK